MIPQRLPRGYVQDSDLATVRRLSKHFTKETLAIHLRERIYEVTPRGCWRIAGYGKQRGVYQQTAGGASAHVAAFACWVGPVDRTLDVAHKCGTHDCINPEHLHQLTRSQNLIEDSKRRVLRVTCPHPRVRGDNGKLKVCAPCNAEAQRRWRHRTGAS